jgi:cytochrome P450
MVMGLFSEEMRRNPYPLYETMRNTSAVYYVPPFDAWMLFDYDTVKWALNDHDAFSSQVPAPPHWLIFIDPPDHARLRAIVSQAFTPRVVASLAQRIGELSRELLDDVVDFKSAQRGEMNLAAEYSVPLPMMVIAETIGMPIADLH